MQRYIVLIFIIFSIQSEEYQCFDGTLLSLSSAINCEELNQPIDFSRIDKNYFIKHILNHPEYATTILPHSFMHLTQFLKYANTTNQGVDFIASIFNMFINKLKSSYYVDAFSFELFLRDLPSLAQGFISFESQSAATKEVVDLLYERFLTNYDGFKKDPDAFFNQLATDIIISIEHHNTDVIRIPIRFFLEVCTSKLIWDVNDAHKTWDSILSLVSCFETLLSCHILRSSQDLDDLLTSLTSRYIFFLDMIGGDISIDFCEQLKICITSGYIPLLDCSYQEADINTNWSSLLRFVHSLEAQVRAREYGYVRLDKEAKKILSKKRPKKYERY